MLCSTHLGSTVDLANFIVCFINSLLMPALILVAVVAFIYHIVVFIANSADEKKQTDAKKYIGWSLGALAILVSVWAIVALGLTSFGINSVIPQFPTE